jgi:hypothetical protein
MKRPLARLSTCQLVHSSCSPATPHLVLLPPLLWPAGEFDIYACNARALALLTEAEVGSPQPLSFNGIPLEALPRVVLCPSFAPTLQDIKVGQGAHSKGSRRAVAGEGWAGRCKPLHQLLLLMQGRRVLRSILGGAAPGLGSHVNVLDVCVVCCPVSATDEHPVVSLHMHAALPCFPGPCRTRLRRAASPCPPGLSWCWRGRGCG